MDKNESKEFQNLIEQFMRVSTQINEMHKGLIHLENGEKLPLGEIHLIECIGKHPETNVSALGDVLGITRSAVSQMAGKLTRKGLVTKSRRDGNEKETFLELTAEGEKVFAAHEKLHKDLYRELSAAMKDINQESFADFRNMMSILERHLGAYRKKYKD